MKKLILLLIMLFVLPISFAYPIIISEEGVEHEKAVNFINSIQPYFLRYVDKIEFTLNSINNKYAVQGHYVYYYNTNYFECEASIKIHYFTRDMESVLVDAINYANEYCDYYLIN